jgi:hypothetical protein
MFRKLPNVRLLNYHTTCTLSWSRQDYSPKRCVHSSNYVWMGMADRSHLWTCRPVHWCSLVIGNSRVDACEHGDGEDVSHSSVDMLTTEDFVLCSSNNIMRTPYSETSVRHLLQPSLSQCSSWLLFYYWLQWQFAKYGRRVLLYTWCSLLLSVLIALLMAFMAFIYSNGIVINHRLVISLHTQIRVPTVSDRAP